jgi:tetratricopeptide (TPR) repeat protein
VGPQLSKGADGNPDLHYNRAAVLKYLEEYNDALAGFQRALEIDPTLPAVVRWHDACRSRHCRAADGVGVLWPVWLCAQDTAETLGRHVFRIGEFVSHKVCAMALTVATSAALVASGEDYALACVERCAGTAETKAHRDVVPVVPQRGCASRDGGQARGRGSQVCHCR